MIAKLRHILGLQTIEEKLEEYTLLKGELSDINDRTDILAEDYITKLNGFNGILKSESYGTEIKERVQKRYTHFLQEQKKEVIGLVNRRHKIEKSISSILKDEKIKDAVNEFELLEKAKSNYRDGNISKNVYNDIIKAKKGKVHYSDNFVFWNGKLLLLQRATDDDGANKWGVPGGHVDAGESHEDAAVRELQEETGLVVDKVVLAGTYSNDDVMIEYYTSYIESDTEPQLILDTAEHQSYRWVDLYRENIDEFEFPFNMKENIKKLLLPKEEKPQDISKAVNMFIDGFISKEVLSDIVKARSGVYENTYENRKLGRVGQRYGSKKAEDKKDLSEKIGSDETPQYKTAKEVQGLLKERGIDKTFTVSQTGWGNSMYFNVSDEKTGERKLKVRISDHPVTNTDRVFGEQHYGGSSDPVQIADEIERAMYPERYDAVQVGTKYIVKVPGSTFDRIIYPEKGDVDIKNKTAWNKESRQDVNENQIKDFEESGDIKIIDKKFVRKSKSGKNMYNIEYKKKYNIEAEPVYKYKRKQGINSDKVEKSLTSLFEQGIISHDVLEKARSGVYADNAKNRRLKRVGQPYGTKKGEDTKEIKEPSKQEETTNKEGKDISIDQYARQSSETALQEAAKGGNEELRLAAKKELDRREKEESVQEEEKDVDISNLDEKGIRDEIKKIDEKLTSLNEELNKLYSDLGLFGRISKKKENKDWVALTQKQSNLRESLIKLKESEDKKSKPEKEKEKDSGEVSEDKKMQFDIIQKTNPMLDEYHVGIRKPQDIKTFDEVVNDEESFVWGDFSKEDAEKALKEGEIIIYSSKPIKQGVFVSTSKIQAEQYAGGVGKKIHSKKVKLEDVAWINGDEGQFASIGKKPPLDKQSKTDTVPDKIEELSDKYRDLMTEAMNDDFSDTEKTNEYANKQREYARYIKRVKEFEGVDKEEHLKKAQELLGLKSEKETKDFFGDGEIIGIIVEDEFVSTLMEDGYCKRGFGNGVVEMLEFILNPDIDKGQGKGSDIFYNQIKSFKEKGYENVITEAAKSEIYNGYYTWARLGYDFSRGSDETEFLNLINSSSDKDIRGVGSLQELMTFDKGRKFWKDNGFAFSGTMSLLDGSKSMFILNKYMEEKKNARK